MTLPVPLEFIIDLGVDKHRFLADIEVPLVLRARARSDLAIVLDVEPPTAQRVRVRLQAQGLRAQLTLVAAGVEGELRRFVAKYVTKELAEPYVREATVIDVAAAVERASASLGPRDEGGAGLTEDLPHALEAEILENADLLLGSEKP